MKREVRLLMVKACDALVLSIEHFNRPSDRGRSQAVLILLDHAFEMLLKAAVVHRGGKIREKRVANMTIGFEACLRKGFSDATIKFLDEHQVLALQAINGLRDAAQHHLLDISEQHLYLQAQGGLTLFRDLMKSVFKLHLRDELPARVLPLSTSPPTDLATMFAAETEEVRKLLVPGSRRRLEAAAKMRALAILEAAVTGQRVQPDHVELQKLAEKVREGVSWDRLFPGVASLELTTKGHGPSLDLRISKKEGISIQVVPEGTPGATVVAIKRVDELGFYNMSSTQLAGHLGITPPRTVALLRFAKVEDDPEAFKLVVLGRSKFKRYSQKALESLRTAMKTADMTTVWRDHAPRAKGS
jgi:hypothetical protein